jgi:NAD(P)-dependent dehydrogenase (short-subunit alcohol dehydrogenase family)
MSTSLAGKIAVVTGATKGIGRAIAESLLKEGSRVAICSRTAADVKRTVSEWNSSYNGRIIGRAADVRDASEVAGFFQYVEAELGAPDILVNNSGLGIFGSVGDLTVEQWNTVLRTNLDGVFFCSREAISRMKTKGGGFIVNISSLAGKNPFAGGGAYNASKFGLNGFSEAMMLDHRNDNIRVSYIMPGSVDTEFNSGHTGSSWKIAPEDIAEIVLSLLKLPERTLVSRVEVRPSRPQKH